MLSDTTRHFARKLNKQVSRVRDPSGFPADVLQREHVSVHFLQQIGFPEAADSVAYEPVQRLLAVGTSDGRIKLIGRRGVEATLLSESCAPTKYLGFLRHRGALLRITSDGAVQLFSVAGRRLLASEWVLGDSVNAVAMVPGAPYVMLGCESGNVRVVLVAGRTGVEGDGVAGPAAGLAVQPYQILGEDLAASGGVVALAVARNGDRPLAVIVHRNSGAVVWDVRSQRILCSAGDEEDDPSKPTCACWVGDRANCFAVGYDDGSVLVWGVPPAAFKIRSARVAASEACVLVLSMRCAPDGADAAPVRSLCFMAGGPGTPGGEDCLLVCGGQSSSDPDMLTLVPLDSEGGAQPTTVPWFGHIQAHALMPPAVGAPSDVPGALMVLTEGGQLVVHDLADWHPSPLTLPFQELPPITASRFLPCLSDAQGRAATPPAGVHHAVTFAKVWACYGAGRGALAEEDERGTEWPFAAGEAAATSPAALGAGCHPSALLLTGHRDGRVRVWDATAQVPRLLAALPSAAAAGQERLRAVTTLEACPFSGLLAVGHAGGDVRLYQFSDRPQAVRRASLDESLVPYDTALAQPAGWQYVLRYSTHSADVTALALPTRLKLLGVGDASGAVSAVDLTQPQRMFQQQPAGAIGVARLAVGPCLGAAAAAQGEAQAGAEHVVLFVASEDSTLSMVSLPGGQPAGKTLRPKNASRPLDLQLLDAHGVTLAPPQGACTLAWADNNAAAAPRSLQMMGASGLGRHGRRGADSFASPAASLAAVSSLEVQELPSDEDDLDAQLAAAAAAAASTGKSKRRSFFRRRSNSPSKTPGSTFAEEAAQAQAPTPERATSADGLAPAASGGSDAIVPDDSPLFPTDSSPEPVSAFIMTPPNQEELADYPYLDAEADAPLATYVLLAAADYLRVYSVESVRQGDRITDRKARLDPPAAFSAAFVSMRGPGVASVALDGTVTLHSVPNLECLLSVPLSSPAALGFPWRIPADAAVAGAGWACSLDGQLLLVAQGNELARLALLGDCAIPAGPASTFDWDLAKAAAAAAKAAAFTGGGRPAQLDVSQRPSSGGSSTGVPTPGSTRVAGRAGSFLTQVKGAASVFVEGAAAAGGAVVQEFERVRGGGAAEPPTLRTLFETPVESLEGGPAADQDDDIDFLDEEEGDAEEHVARSGGSVANRAKDMTAAALAGAAQQGAKLTAMLPFGRKPSEELGEREHEQRQPEASERDRRQELLGVAPAQRAGSSDRRTAAMPPPPPLPGRATGSGGRNKALARRTASEIKRTYGNSRAQDARVVAERNREMLAERGRKLANLEEKSAQLEGGAQDFESMAKELNDAFANRKWWQI